MMIEAAITLHHEDKTMAKRPTLNIMNSTTPAPVIPQITPITGADGKPIAGTDKNIVDGIRSFYTKFVKYGPEDYEQHHTQFSDTAIWDIYTKLLAQYPTNDPTTLFGSVMARIVNAENAAAQDAAIDPNVDTRIRDAANLMAGDEEFDALLQSSFDAHDVLKTTIPEIISHLLQRMAMVQCVENGTTVQRPWYPGAMGSFTCPTIDGWPEPGHNEGEKNDDGTPIIMQNTGWDTYWTIPTGSNRRVKASFYKTMAASFGAGARLVAMKTEMLKASVTPQTGQYADDYSTDEASGICDNIDNKITTAAGWVRSAVRIIRQMQSMNSMKHMQCGLVTNMHNVSDDKGVLTQVERLTLAPNKIVVAEKHATGGRWQMTFEKFMRYDCELAEVAGGTMKALDKTAEAEKRTPNSGTGNTAVEQPKWTLINFTDNMVRFGDFIGNMDNAAAIQRFFNDPDPTKSDAALKSMADAFTSIRSMFASHPEYVARAEGLLGYSAGTIGMWITGDAVKAPKLNVG